MKLRNKILLFFLLLICHSVAMADTEQLVLHEQPSDRWAIDCDLPAPEGFAENVMIYQYVQQKAADKLKDIKQAQHSNDIPLLMVADKHRRSLIYASPAACMLTIPEAAADDVMSEKHEQLINLIMTCLTDAGFHPYVTPYSVLSLQSMLDKQNAATTVTFWIGMRLQKASEMKIN